MRKYDQYKPSKENWLMEIPTSWESVKMKYLFSERSEKGFPDEPLLVASQNMGVVPKDVYGGRTVEASKDLHLLKLVKIDDFVISLRSFQGGIERAYYQGIISPAYTILVPHSISVGYFKCLGKATVFIQLLKSCVTGIREGQNIDYKVLKNKRIPVPPRPEQDQIVRFLDWKVSGINKLINIKKRELKELEELKSSRIKKIFEEVSADSLKLKYIAKSYGRIGFRGYNATDMVSQGDGAITISPSNIKENSMNYDSCAYLSWEKYNESPEIQVNMGDILFVKTGSSYGKIGFISFTPPEKATINPQIFIIRTKSDFVINEYLYLFMKYGSVQDDINKGVIGSTIPTISELKVMNMKIIVPTLMEQQEIANSINSIIIRHSELRKTFSEEIDTLHELKNRLISDVVTGQIDVRDVEIPDFEFEDESVDTTEEDLEDEVTE